MMIHSNSKIELATSKDKELLSEPYFTGKELVATDGHILAVVPVTGCQDDTPGYISGAFLKRLRGGRPSLGGEIRLDANGDLTGVHRKEGTLKVERPLKDDHYVDWQNILPGERKEALVALDPELLLRLSQAIGLENSVRLHIPLDGEGRIMPYEKILVTPNDWEENRENYGVIMPCRMKEPAQENEEAASRDGANDGEEIPADPPKIEAPEEKAPADNPQDETDGLEEPETGVETEPEEEGVCQSPKVEPDEGDGRTNAKGKELEGWEEFSHVPDPEPDEEEGGEATFGPCAGSGVPKVRKVRFENVFTRGHDLRVVTKVHFTDKRVLTFAGALALEDARYQGYLRRAQEAGMDMEEAGAFARTKAAGGQSHSGVPKQRLRKGGHRQA